MKNKLIKILILMAALSFICGCSVKNDVKNKVFVNSSVLIMLFEDGTCSYSGILYGRYKYDDEKKLLTINYTDNYGLQQTRFYNYDSSKNCLYDKANKRYEYKAKASEVKMGK